MPHADAGNSATPPDYLVDMGSVLTPSAAMVALVGADIGAASPAECVDLLGHARLVRGWLDAVEARVSSRVTEHHAAGQSAPAADTHTACGGVSAAEGRRKERRSKTINDAPRFGEALAEGGIGAEHVDQLATATARLDDSVKAALLDQDDLLDAARSQTPEKFGQTVRDRARTLEADNGVERNKQQRKQTFISHKVNHETGMHEGRFAFHPQLGAQIFSAIDRQVRKNIKAGVARGEAEFVDRTFDYSQQSAVALGDIVTAGNTNIDALQPLRSGQPGTGTQAADEMPPSGLAPSSTDAQPPCGSDTADAQRPGGARNETGPVMESEPDGVGGGECRAIEADITVIIDYQTVVTGEFHDRSVCETSDGAVLPPASVQRLLCNGRVTPVFVDANGNPFDLGRTVRHANRKQRRALRAMYRSCGFPGCDVGFGRCEMHHILPWELGGLTDLSNLVPICSRHHHVIHEGGWQLHLAPDRTLTITQPNGQTYGTASPDIRVGASGGGHSSARRSSRSPVGSLASDELAPPRGSSPSLAEPRASVGYPARAAGLDDVGQRRASEQMDLLAG